MSLVTVCIPSFRSAKCLHETLESVVGQTFQDFLIEIGTEPTEDLRETLSIVESFTDERIIARVNDRVLGWGSNVNQILGRVKTPYFCILPHDDVWDSKYLEILVSAIDRHPEASVAYADMAFFGHASGFKSVSIEGRRPFERLASFYLEGAEAVPWRGVTRTTVLNKGLAFQDNAFGGFAVECEWAQMLLIAGEVVHIPQPLYLKRIHEKSVVTVSRSWGLSFDASQQKQSLRWHSEKMESGFLNAPLTLFEREVIKTLHTAAMLRRYAARFAFEEDEISAIEKTISALNVRGLPFKSAILSRLHLVLSRDAFRKNDVAIATELALQSVALDKKNFEALEHLATIQLSKNEQHAALSTVMQAMAIVRPTQRMMMLLKMCTNRLSKKAG